MDKDSVLALLCLLQLTNFAGAKDQGNEQIRRIDTHCHYLPDFYGKLLTENNVTAGGFPVPAWNATSHIQLMDKLNISLSLASVSTPGAVIEKGFPINQSRKLARRLNKYGNNLTRQYPNRFRFLATLTLPDVEGSVAEAIYALDRLKAAGVILLASNFGEVLGSPLYEPLYAELNQRNAVVFVHPSNSPCPEPEESTAQSTGLPPAAVDFLLDTTRAAVNLIYRNVTQKYPNIRFILAHSGGFLSFATYRVIGILRLLTTWSENFIISQLQQFYVDTALSGSRWALPSTLALFNATHLTFGSDFPFTTLAGILDNTLNAERYIQQNSNAEVLDQIRFKTASQLFNDCGVVLSVPSV